ncbi:aldehyde dehydrogenase family protein [Paraburkholderia bannensis]|uniref:aldehyde dehydrogenase family protein n=1 Tax=Paraburkholderia bannensis TaxID=765414 RepID=UPI002AC35FF8|nr:aldehyde dehydrogenase family protein [Paraburkholderia bannensis]
MNDRHVLAVDDTSAAIAASLAARLEPMREAFLAAQPVALEVRRDRLRRAIAMTLAHADRIVAASQRDFPNRAPELARLNEVFMPLDALRRAERSLTRWMKPERRRAPAPFSLFGASASIEYQPLGVVGVISPWNGAITLLLLPLATILAAGNRAFLRPSDQTPHSAAAIDAAVREYFDPDEVTVALGGPEVSVEFSKLPFDHLLFTGSTSVGRVVAEAAGRNLTPVTLELGGKCPVYVMPDADTEEVGKRLAFGKLINAGQGCLCPDTVYAAPAVAEKVLAAMDAEVRRQSPGGIASSEVCGIFGARQYERLSAIVADARAQGAQIRTLGVDVGALATMDDQHKMAPVVIVDPPQTARASREELFGPVMVLHTRDDLDTVLARQRQRDKPLGLYVFSRSGARVRHVLDRSFSGGVTINDTIMHLSVPDLPFGGVGHSGTGAYGFGVEGFRRFSHARAVYRRAGPYSLVRAMHPPFGRLYDFAVVRTLRRLARQYAKVAPRHPR